MPIVSDTSDLELAQNPTEFHPLKKLQGSRWSRKAIKSFAMAELEARKLKYLTSRTGALLMGILIEANAITLLKVREETVNLLGKADIYFLSPKHPPMTEETQRVLDHAVDNKLKFGDGGEITTTDMVLAIWSEVESPGHKIMDALGFNDEKAIELDSSSFDSGYLDD